MPAPRHMHEIVDRAWDEYMVFEALNEVCNELNVAKPRDGGWHEAIDAISMRDHGKPVANLGSSELIEYHGKLLDQLKAAPGGGAGGAGTAGGRVPAPDNSEDSDGIPD